MDAQEKLNQIEDILVNRYGYENEPLSDSELRRILNSIVSIFDGLTDKIATSSK